MMMYEETCMTFRVMVYRRLALLVICVCWLALLKAPAQGQRDGGLQREARRHGWEFNYRAAQRQARETGKPLMVVVRCVP